MQIIENNFVVSVNPDTRAIKIIPLVTPTGAENLLLVEQALRAEWAAIDAKALEDAGVVLYKHDRHYGGKYFVDDAAMQKWADSLDDKEFAHLIEHNDCDDCDQLREFMSFTPLLRWDRDGKKGWNFFCYASNYRNPLPNFKGTAEEFVIAINNIGGYKARKICDTVVFAYVPLSQTT
jgi:hypothetical protein